MLEVCDLSKVFGNRTLWRDVNLSAKEGEMIALVGPSGSGKSTLLNCLGLLDKPSSGSIRHEGKEITKFKAGETRRFRRDTLGYLFQNYALMENATVAENLEVAVKPRRKPGGKGDAAMGEALERVGLAGREQEKIHVLSGGEQQRVAIARLIVQKPRIVLADEPTGALDDVNATTVIDVLRDLSNGGCTVVIATHDDVVRGRCDSAYNVHNKSLVDVS